MDKIRIAIVEDDPSWMELMTDFLNKEEDFTVVGKAFNKDEAIQLMIELSSGIDIILMDINLSENKYDGISTALEIFENWKIKIIMLTSLSGDDLIKDSFSAGAVNFVSKENYRDIPGIIRSALRETSPMEILLDDYRKMKENAMLSKLSPSEKELYMLASEGYSRTQIQQKLYKTENTIKSQVSSILKKFNSHSLSEVIGKIRNRGIHGDKYSGDE
jgi:two-component system, NarL family, response regulator DevR